MRPFPVQSRWIITFVLDFYYDINSIWIESSIYLGLLSNINKITLSVFCAFLCSCWVLSSEYTPGQFSKCYKRFFSKILDPPTNAKRRENSITFIFQSEIDIFGLRRGAKVFSGKDPGLKCGWGAWRWSWCIIRTEALTRRIKWRENNCRSWL